MPALTLLAAALVACPVPRIHDGDTLWCGREKVRIVNIDAPELSGSPPCEDGRRFRAWCDYAAGAASRGALRAMTARGQVTIERTGIDRYGRTLAVVRVNGRDAGAELVRLGLARWWR